MDKVLEQWGQPALISAIVALIVALLSRKLPFQQKLNEAQLATLERLFAALLDSHRKFVNHLNLALFTYQDALNDPDLDEQEKAQVEFEFRKSFLTPDLIKPSQDFTHSFVVPSEVQRAVIDYMVAAQTLVTVAFIKTRETGAQTAWDFVLEHVEQPIADVSRSIRYSLGIDELTSENKRAAGTLWRTRVQRARDWWRWRFHGEKPAGSYWSLIYHGQLSRLQDMAARDLGQEVEGDPPEHSDVAGKQSGKPTPRMTDQQQQEMHEVLRQMRTSRADIRPASATTEASEAVSEPPETAPDPSETVSEASRTAPEPS